jgi:hypothetical protein
MGVMKQDCNGIASARPEPAPRAEFARKNAGLLASASSAGVQARSFVIAGDSRRWPFDAVTAKSALCHFGSDHAIALQIAGSAHGERRDASETNIGNFCTSTRDRACVHDGVSVSSNPKWGHIDPLCSAGLSYGCQGSAKA